MATTRQRARQKRQLVYRRKSLVRQREQESHALVAHKQRLIAKAIPLEDLPEVDPAEAMQMMINRVAMLVRAAAAESDRLKPGLGKNQSERDHELWGSWDANGNLVVQGNYWIEHEAKLRDELAKLTEKAQALGLSERRTRVKEAQVVLLGEALAKAARAAGLPESTQRALGAALRAELATIEGTAIEVGT